MATFADDTSILTTKKSAKDSNEALQTAFESINTWTKKWRIKLNQQKSVHVVFITMQNPVNNNLYLDGIKTLFQQRQIPRYVFGHKVKMERARQKEKYRT